MRDYRVFVSLDRQRTWALHPEPISASGSGQKGRDNACEALRAKSPELRGNEDAAFYAVPASDFKPQAKKKELVEKWSWQPIEDEAQQKIGGTT